MGGYGSGNSLTRLSKWTVEESIAVEMRDFQTAIYARSPNNYSLTWESGFNELSIGLLLDWDTAGPSVTLDYCYDEEMIWIPIRLQISPTNFDGERWWFTRANAFQLAHFSSFSR